MFTHHDGSTLLKGPGRMGKMPFRRIIFNAPKRGPPKERPLDLLTVSDASHHCDFPEEPMGRCYINHVKIILPLNPPCSGR
jgi:hypothetical protein